MKHIAHSDILAYIDCCRKGPIFGESIGYLPYISNILAGGIDCSNSINIVRGQDFLTINALMRRIDMTDLLINISEQLYGE